MAATRLRAPAVILVTIGLVLTTPSPGRGHDETDKGTETEAGSGDGHGPARCVAGRAGEFPCANVDLLSAMPLAEVGGGRGNDLWGWTDPATGREYALLGRTNGTAFVDITDPERPVWVADLPSQSFDSSWRDIKVYDNHALVVSEAIEHGLQIFDLTQLREVDRPPAVFAASAVYDRFGSAHNIAVNGETGFAYVVGGGGGACGPGLHMIDVSEPSQPSFAGCFDGDGYTHDVQCVIYRGPDFDHQGKEVCFASNEDTLTVVDVTDKELPALISRTGYARVGYVHQGWLTDDHRYFLGDDELDERNFGHQTHTLIWDLRDLDAPVLAGIHEGPTTASDHNQYVRGRYVYQANYRAGLRILRLEALARGRLREVASFDVYPADDRPGFDGAWSVYPYFASGTVVVSSIERGLFVLRPRLGGAMRTRIPGLDYRSILCRDETDKLSATLPPPSGANFNCRNSGLDLAAGDRLRQEVRGLAGRARIAGTVRGLAPRRYKCQNLDSGSSAVLSTDAGTFDCAEMGVRFAPGDRLLIKIWGRIP